MGWGGDALPQHSTGGAWGGAHLPAGVQGLLCSQQHPRQDGEELQAHLWVPGGLQAAPEDGDEVGQRGSEGRAWNTEAASVPPGPAPTSAPPAPIPEQWPP